jgi:peptide/nickel transport system permease protein
MTEATAEELDRRAEDQQLNAQPVRSFWRLVTGIFWASWMNRIATAWVFLLIAITVVVPFVANGQPFTIVFHKPTGDVRAFPLFSTLSNIDLSLLFAVAAAVVWLALRLWLRRKREWQPERLSAWRLYSALGLAFAATVAIVLLFALHTPYSAPYDYRDYQELMKNKQASGAVFTLIPWHYADFEPLRDNLTYQYPSADHWLGTDDIGRDYLSRLLWSTRVIMGIGFISETIALIIGVIVGALIGYYSRLVDLIGMRLVEIFESIPAFFLILIFIAIYGRQIFMIMVILGLVGWTGIARFLRAEFLRLRSMDFVQAAIASGLPLRRVLFRHMLPNGLTPVIVTFTFGVAGAIMSESGLSFLGVGVEPPIPSWGQMLNSAGNPSETFRWWLAMPPGLMIFLTVFAYNIIGEGMRDALDPRTFK